MPKLLFNRLQTSIQSKFMSLMSMLGIKKSLLDKQRIFGKKNINAITQELNFAWKNKQIPSEQREIVNQQIKDYRLGKKIDIFDLLVRELRGIQEQQVKERQRILEIGCSSGYYSEVFEIAQLKLEYIGCDYSEEFVALAKTIYPGTVFIIADARDLPFLDDSFDIVISGCCILHIREYEIAIQEAARVSSNYVLFHRTPVLINQKTTFYTKIAYGVQMFEIHFNELELQKIFIKNKLILERVITISSKKRPNGQEIQANRLYVCKKI